MSNEKYYVGSIYERNGEREYTHGVIFSAPTEAGANAILNCFAKEWLGKPGDYDSRLDGYFFDAGNYFIRAERWQEVSKNDYDTLCKYSFFQERVKNVN